VAPVLEALRQGLAVQLGDPAPAAGTVVVRLEVEGCGRVTRLHWLLNTLLALPLGQQPPWVATDAQLAAVVEHCCSARFPAAPDGGGTTITLPLVWT
jgi:hypothetical protein